MELEELQKAIAEYINEKGGSAVVIGGSEILKMPTDPEFNYRICFKITGKMPVKITGPGE
jgi:hypothetical protein